MLGYYRSPLAGPVDLVFRLYFLLLVARIVCSWLPIDRRSKGYGYLLRATEPFLAPFRRAVPPMGGIDFSPILAFMVLEIIEDLVMRFLVY